MLDKGQFHPAPKGPSTAKSRAIVFVPLWKQIEEREKYCCATAAQREE